MKSHKLGPGRLIGLVALVGLCTGVDDARAQSPFYLRVGAETGSITVEHTKKVTIGDGSSSRTSSSTGLALAGSVAAGLRFGLPGNWMVGGEVEGIASSRRKLEGTISPTRSGNHAAAQVAAGLSSPLLPFTHRLGGRRRVGAARLSIQHERRADLRRDSCLRLIGWG